MDASPSPHAVTVATLESIRRATAHLSAADLPRRRPGKWSIAQILEHLEKTYTSTAHILGRCADLGVAKGGVPTLKNRFQAWIVVGLGFFPTGVKTPDVAMPADAPEPGGLDRAIAALRAFDAAAWRSEDRLGARAKVANHPILGPFTVEQWRRFHLFHTRHHVKQIRALGRRGKAEGGRE